MDTYDVWEQQLSGDSKRVAHNISKERAYKIVNELNKKCNWTVYYYAVKQLIY
jgi:hypothetical protein